MLRALSRDLVAWNLPAHIWQFTMRFERLLSGVSNIYFLTKSTPAYMLLFILRVSKVSSGEQEDFQRAEENREYLDFWKKEAP